MPAFEMVIPKHLATRKETRELIRSYVKLAGSYANSLTLADIEECFTVAHNLCKGLKASHLDTTGEIPGEIQ
jgi:hypothetical protein